LGIFREFEREVSFFIQHYQYLTKKKSTWCEFGHLDMQGWRQCKGLGGL